MQSFTTQQPASDSQKFTTVLDAMRQSLQEGKRPAVALLDILSATAPRANPVTVARMIADMIRSAKPISVESNFCSAFVMGMDWMERSIGEALSGQNPDAKMAFQNQDGGFEEVKPEELAGLKVPAPSGKHVCRSETERPLAILVHQPDETDRRLYVVTATHRQTGYAYSLVCKNRSLLIQTDRLTEAVREFDPRSGVWEIVCTQVESNGIPKAKAA